MPATGRAIIVVIHAKITTSAVLPYRAGFAAMVAIMAMVMYVSLFFISKDAPISEGATRNDQAAALAA